MLTKAKHLPGFFSMETINGIKSWLNQPTYWEGVQLYVKYGDNAYLKKQFRENSDSWLKSLLAKELTELLAQLEAQEQAKVMARPAEVEALLKEAKSLMDERTALKERARVYVEQGHDESPELEAIVRRIMEEIRPRLDEIYGLRDFWDANGYLPASAEVAVQTVGELYKRRNALRVYISRAKEGNPKLELWKAELFGIETKLKALE